MNQREKNKEKKVWIRLVAEALLVFVLNSQIFTYIRGGESEWADQIDASSTNGPNAKALKIWT